MILVNVQVRKLMTLTAKFNKTSHVHQQNKV